MAVPEQEVTLEELMTYKEAAEYLQVSYGAINKAVIAKHFVPVKIPGIHQKYIHRDAVMSYGKRPVPKRVKHGTSFDVHDLYKQNAIALAKEIQDNTAETLASANASLIAARIALMQTAMGVPVSADPKWLRASYTR